MKKQVLFFAFAMLCSIQSIIAQPQGGGDPAQRKAMMKERVKPMLIEQTKLSDSEADKVLDILLDAQFEEMKLRRNEEMNEEDKEAKRKEIVTERDKKLNEIPLTDNQIKIITDFFAEMRKRQQERRGQ